MEYLTEVEIAPGIRGQLYGDFENPQEPSYALKTEVGNFIWGWTKISEDWEQRWKFERDEVCSGIATIDTFCTIAEWAKRNLIGKPTVKEDGTVIIFVEKKPCDPTTL